MGGRRNDFGIGNSQELRDRSALVRAEGRAHGFHLSRFQSLQDGLGRHLPEGFGQGRPGSAGGAMADGATGVEQSLHILRTRGAGRQ